MGRCIICGCDTEDFRCCVREDNEGNMHDDYQCKECTIEKIEKEHLTYKKEFDDKVLPFLIKNEFKVIVEGGFNSAIEEFPILKESVRFPIDVMDAVDIIRERMNKLGYYENWIDVHWEEFNGVELEIVDYLSFALPGKDCEEWVSFFLRLEGKDGIKLNRV